MRRLIGGGLALMIVALSPHLLEGAAAQEAGLTTAGEHGAVTNWASDVATQAASARGQVVQWSLSYDAYVDVQGAPGNRYPIAQVHRTMICEER
jgi:hypothetical protein